MIKKTVISAATIVMPRAHRKELTGLKALKGIGRD
ncbi:phosphoribosylaminoimidazole carboxylase, partial [Brucella melitensis]